MLEKQARRNEIVKATYLYEMGIESKTKDKKVARYLRALPKDNLRVENNMALPKTKSPMASTVKKLLFNASPKNKVARKASHSPLPAKQRFIRKVIKDRSEPVIRPYVASA